MATKNVALHNATLQDVYDAQDWLENYGTLDGWQSQNGTGNSAQSWQSIWRGMGVPMTPEGISKQLEFSRQQYESGPRKAKIGRLSDKAGEVLPYLAMAAQFVPGVGTALSSAVGPKVAGVLTGAAKFSNNPLMNYGAQALASKALPGLGKGFLIANMGKALNTPGAKAMSQIPGMLGFLTPPPITGVRADLEQTNHSQNGTTSISSASGTGAGMLAGVLGEGGLKIPETTQIKWEQLSALPGGSSAPNSNMGQSQNNGILQHQPINSPNAFNNTLGLGLLAGLVEKVFKKDDRTAPAPQPVASLPSYGNLLGMATNADAQADQRARLRALGRRI